MSTMTEPTVRMRDPAGIPTDVPFDDMRARLADGWTLAYARLYYEIVYGWGWHCEPCDMGVVDLWRPRTRCTSRAGAQMLADKHDAHYHPIV